MSAFELIQKGIVKMTQQEKVEDLNDKVPFKKQQIKQGFLITNSVDSTKIGIQCVNVAVAAKALGVGRSSLYEAVKRKEIPSVRIGRRVVIPIAAILKLLEVEVNS